MQPFTMRRFTLLIGLLTAPVALHAGVKAGFAERDITPGIGMEQPGGYGKSYHRTFHDPCKVRAAVFDDGQKRIALVGLDSLIVPRTVVLKARAQIQKITGLPPEAVLIAASHSHSSGPVGMVQPGEFDDASDLVKKLAYEESSCADPGYLLHLTHQIVEAVRLADVGKVAAHLGFGSGTEDQVGFNRRLKMKNGLAYSHPGAGNPDMIDYAGPIDPAVGVIAAWNETGDLLGTVVNFSCHATTSPGGISANWIYYLEQTLQGATHSRAPVVFLQGACGDVTQVDNLSPFQRPAPVEWAQRVGGRVGAEAYKTLLMMTRSPEAKVDLRQKTFTIPRRKPSADRLAQSRQIVEAGKPKGDPTAWLFAKEIVMLDHLIQKEPEVEVEVQTLQLGPAVFVTNPAEYFVQLGLDIKAASPFPLTFPVELANGCVGYVPTEEAFGPNGGGYETRLTAYSNLVITAGTTLRDTGIELAKSMTPDPLPQPPKAPPFTRPWTYGSVPPEIE
jgi:neutral ceramidase